MDLGRLPPFQRARQNFGSGGSGLLGGRAARRFAPSLLPMLRRASQLAQYRRARPAAAMTIGNATTGLNGTNAPMTSPPPQSERCSLADPACVLTDGSYSFFSPCLTDEPSNGIGEEQDNYGAEPSRLIDRWYSIA